MSLLLALQNSDVQFAGASAGGSTVAGTLTVEVRLAAGSDGVGSASAALTVEVRLAGSSHGTSSAEGSLTVTGVEEPPATGGGGGGGCGTSPRERRVVSLKGSSAGRSRCEGRLQVDLAPPPNKPQSEPTDEMLAIILLIV